MMFAKPALFTLPSTSAIRSKLRALVPLLAVCAAACDDMEGLSADAELDEAVLQDELELAAEAPEEEEPDHALAPADGLDDLQAANKPAKGRRYLCCDLEFSDPFKVAVILDNPDFILSDCSDLFAGYYPITIKVHHLYNTPAPFLDTTHSLPLGDFRRIPLSHPGYMNADYCEAWYDIP